MFYLLFHASFNRGLKVRLWLATLLNCEQCRLGGIGRRCSMRRVHVKGDVHHATSLAYAPVDESTNDEMV